MNIVIYAGDRKYYSVLQPIAEELKTTSHSFLFFYTKHTQLLFPTHPQHQQYFEYDGQINKENPQISETLGIQIPFIPDVLILARERWQPEQSIIHEFKTKWQCKVCCVEVSSHLVNNIENRLEMLSRTQYPQNQIDYFFEHSNWAKDRRVDCLDESFRRKTIVVGNTRNYHSSDLFSLKQKYSIDDNKQQILFWGVINTTRDTALKALQTLSQATKDTHQIFYKCYPGEPYNERFVKDFNPFCIDNVQVIYDEEDIYGMSELCDTHIAAASSVFSFAFVHNKKIVNLDSVCHASIHMNDIDTYLNETNHGVEDSAKFWMNVWKLNSQKDFVDLVNKEKVLIFNQTNEEFINEVYNNTIDFDWELQFLTKKKKDYGSLIEYFDSYQFDNKASLRIINILNDEINKRNF